MGVTLRTEHAYQDLLGIWDWIAEDSTAAADAFLDRVDGICQMLADNPTAGRARSDLGADIRSFPGGEFVIYYRPFQDGIEVVRFLHGKRDFPESW